MSYIDRNPPNPRRAIKEPVRLATTAAITLSGLQSIDGVTTAENDRVLVKDQASTAENGIYYARAGAWERAPDWGTSASFYNVTVVPGTQVFVTEGSTNGGKMWHVVTANAINHTTIQTTFARTLADMEADIEADSVTITPPTGTGKALDIHQTGTGGAGSGTIPLNTILVGTENIDGGGVAAKVNALNIAHGYGGAAARGGRNTLEVYSILQDATSSANPDRNYCAVAAQAVADSDDGGTAPAPKGAIFGLNTVGAANSGATHLAHVTSAEANIAMRTGSSVAYKSGVNITQMADDAVQGSGFDAALSLSNISGAVGWKHGILFSAANSEHPMHSSGTLIATSGSDTVLNGIDFTSYAFTGYSLKLTGFQVGPTGNLAMAATNASIEIGALGSANTPYIDFHSGATATDYDARLLAQGGTGSSGGGKLTAFAAEFAVSGKSTAANGMLVAGDNGGQASTVGLTGTSDVSANSTGTGTIKFKGATSRDSAGFLKVYIDTTAYYVPVFSGITG